MTTPPHLWRRCFAPRLLFCAALLFFVWRGPYRAIRYSTTGDFSTLYAATRCWLHGTDPYLRSALQSELSRAGAPLSLIRDQETNASVYLPAAFPLAASFALAPWRGANVAWCALSLALYGASLLVLMRAARLTRGTRWLIAAAALLFSPAYVGIYDGNPSVVAIALVTLALCRAAAGANWSPTILLGLACAFKPQLAVCALAALVLWRRPKTLAGALVLFAALLLWGAGRLTSTPPAAHWLAEEQRNLALSFQPGGTSDPSPGSPVAFQLLNGQTLAAYAFTDARIANALVWLFAGLLGAEFLRRRRPAAKARLDTRWWDLAVLAPLTLVIAYHRYYDAQLLLLLIPALAGGWRRGQRRIVLAALLCLLALAFPIQSVFARWLGPAALLPSVSQFLLLRLQPAAVIVLAVALVFSYPRAQREI